MSDPFELTQDRYVFSFTIYQLKLARFCQQISIPDQGHPEDRLHAGAGEGSLRIRGGPAASEAGTQSSASLLLNCMFSGFSLSALFLINS